VYCPNCQVWRTTYRSPRQKTGLSAKRRFFPTRSGIARRKCRLKHLIIINIVMIPARGYRSIHTNLPDVRHRQTRYPLLTPSIARACGAVRHLRPNFAPQAREKLPGKETGWPTWALGTFRTASDAWAVTDDKPENRIAWYVFAASRGTGRPSGPRTIMPLRNGRRVPRRNGSLRRTRPAASRHHGTRL
jgi:hypothetical protein